MKGGFTKPVFRMTRLPPVTALSANPVFGCVADAEMRSRAAPISPTEPNKPRAALKPSPNVSPDSTDFGLIRFSVPTPPEAGLATERVATNQTTIAAINNAQKLTSLSEANPDNLRLGNAPARTATR